MSQSSGEKGGMTAVVLACCAIGAVTVGATLTLTRGRMERSPANVPSIATEEYGKRLIAQTYELLGPDVADPKMRYTNSRLACGSCHLGAGMEAGTLTLLQATQHYPRFAARTGTTTDIEDRVNECMQRSMNGRALPRTSPEMIAMAAYIRGLGEQYAAMGATLRKVKEPAAPRIPERVADLKSGKEMFEKRCVACHGKDGLGLLATANPLHGYVFPPLWGNDSFNDGAGMHRVQTAARFIKARMPLGRPDLDDDQAFDVAAYINSQPRPEMSGLDKDFPDRSAKPSDTPYGPYADTFPIEQHRFGPYKPIDDYYKKLKASKAK